MLFIILVKFQQLFCGHSINSLTDTNKFHFSMSLVTWNMPLRGRREGVEEM